MMMEGILGRKAMKIVIEYVDDFKANRYALRRWSIFRICQGQNLRKFRHYDSRCEDLIVTYEG